MNPTEENVRRVYKSICDFWGKSIEGISVKDFLDPDKFFVLGKEPNRIDIFSNLPGIVFSEAWKRKIVTKFSGVTVYVISVFDLLKNFEEVKKSSSKQEVISKYDYFIRRLKAWQEKEQNGL